MTQDQTLKLTGKQEAFCLAYMETGNASEAYRRVYNADDMKPETINRKATELMNNGKITARIETLQAQAVERNNITVDDLLNKLENIYKEAMNKERLQLSSAISAVMGQAKILGYDKQIIDLQSQGKPLPTAINVTFSDKKEMSND